jgi:uncharacterized membrane protein
LLVSEAQEKGKIISHFSYSFLGFHCLRLSHILFDTDRDLTSRVDLTAAKHMHIVEPHWNPMAEAQAIDRVHRIGQTREVTVTRYIVSNTIETVCSF